jgi:hypothetical protein
VQDIEKDLFGNPKDAIISVSVDGNNYTVKRSLQKFDFEVETNLFLTVDCIVKGGFKKLKFRKIQQTKLDEEEKELLKRL